MSNKYAQNILDCIEGCDIQDENDLQNLAYAFMTGMESTVNTLNAALGFEQHVLGAQGALWFSDTLENIMWLAIPAAKPSAHCNVDNALTKVCALGLAKTHFLCVLDPENAQKHYDNYLEAVQTLTVAGVLAVLTVNAREMMSAELMDSMKTDYTDRLRALNTEFCDRWSSYAKEKYGVSFGVGGYRDN